MTNDVRNTWGHFGQVLYQLKPNLRRKNINRKKFVKKNLACVFFLTKHA